MTRKRRTVELRVDGRKKRKWQRLAERDGLSLSEVIRELLARWETGLIDLTAPDANGLPTRRELRELGEPLRAAADELTRFLESYGRTLYEDYAKEGAAESIGDLLEQAESNLAGVS